MDKVFNKAQKIILEAENNEDFFAKYANNLVGTGENSVDYSVYDIDINDDYSLIIDFADFSFQNFSLVYKSHRQHFAISEQLYNSES